MPPLATLCFFSFILHPIRSSKAHAVQSRRVLEARSTRTIHNVCSRAVGFYPIENRGVLLAGLKSDLFEERVDPGQCDHDGLFGSHRPGALIFDDVDPGVKEVLGALSVELDVRVLLHGELEPAQATKDDQGVAELGWQRWHRFARGEGYWGG